MTLTVRRRAAFTEHAAQSGRQCEQTLASCLWKLQPALDSGAVAEHRRAPHTVPLTLLQGEMSLCLAPRRCGSSCLFSALIQLISAPSLSFDFSFALPLSNLRLAATVSPAATCAARPR